MAKAELIDDHVSLQQCKHAIDVLIAHESKKEEARNENELLPGNEQNVWLVVTTKKMHSTHRIKPIKIPITHPIVDPRTTSICLITKDPQREYKDLLEQQGIKFISRVVGIAKLKGKFKPFEARRMLLKENGMFLADDRVIPILPKLLGSKWFKAKKQPIPVSLSRKDLKGELERAISSTYMHQNQGTCTSIKIGTLTHNPSQILANLRTALPHIIASIKDGWKNIQSLHLKTNESVSLPLWTCSLDVEEGNGGRWDGLIAKQEQESEGNEEDGSDVEEGESEDESEDEEVKPTKKGKRRAGDEITDTPKKKAKGTQGQSVSTTLSTSKTDVKSKSKPNASKKSDSSDGNEKPKSSTKAEQSAKKTLDASASSTPGTKAAKGKHASSQQKDSDTSSPAKGISKKATKTSETTTTQKSSQKEKPPSKPSITPLSTNENSSAKPKPPKTSSASKPHPELASKKDLIKDKSIAIDELKKKRAGEAVMKKKEKSVGLKGVKSVKAGLLGKKVAKS